ncbi:L-tyrosine/L-tryptophan isonitrile synthase family protein [Saccharopolyspora sp. K220]|uniref:L-tyrosine/L-tryptophan isonitrile synthase family protein n=1 Tax=Saccharopolyspora soli TaxID=2926618 RepID=UPI001F57A1F2|nr:L-tyrosine/L-tryptophan isonitrile synthase family protein [Saccharopolyspora soli]MCI2422284.1 L-tyrosine/L-tryptophan isonitrile synthase family protein [Saccharopolyspora soli]
MTARLTSQLSTPAGRSRAAGEADEPRPAPGLWHPLTIPDANALLADGGYGLWVEQSAHGALRLSGAGTGAGLPLGVQPNWADLYRALIRLRRTRRIFNSTWLHRLTRSLGTDGGTGSSVPLPVDRVHLMASEQRQLAEDCLAAVTGPNRSVPFPAERITVSGPERTVQLQAAGPREQALCQLRGWERLSSIVESDPNLRMHCATQPVPAAVVDTATGSAALTRIAEPAPAHPTHPGGTIAANLSTLLRPVGDGTPGVLRVVLDNRFERREDELEYFLEHFVRPLLRAFRLALDTHRIGLFSLDDTGVAFELSPELQATGRIVLTDYMRVSHEPTRAEVATGVRALVATLDELSAGFSRLEAGRRESRVRRAVDRVIAEELRYLAPHTAELLSGEQPLQCYAHTVPESQDVVLKSVLDRVQHRNQQRRWNDRLPQPTVVVDIDLCGLVPLQRILDAARSISGPRPGAPEGILELAGPGTLPVLPTHTAATWHNFVELSGLGERYPSVDWTAVHTDFVRAFLSRSRERLRTDSVNAGLARFVWDVQDAGGRVVFCTGRRERFREHTEEVLAAAGVPDATLLCLPEDGSRPRAELKVEKLRELGELDVVAIFDDELANRIAVTKEFSAALAVAVEIPGLAAERRPGQPVADSAAMIATFETTPRPGTSVGPRLSNTHSLEELQIGALRKNRLAQHWAVHLTEQESHSIVDAMLVDVDRAAARTGRGAVAKFGLDERSGTDQVLAALHHVLTRKQFIKGSRANYQPSDLRRDAEPFVRRGEPIDVVLLGFPVKQCLNRLKAGGPLPDLAELGSMARLRELHRAVSAVYPPGLHFNILTDGRHFRSRPSAITEAYRKKLREYVELVGIGDRTTVEEIDAVAEQRLGPGLQARRAVRIARYRQLLSDSLRHFDITDNPLRTLERVHQRTASIAEFQPHIIGLFREILMSLVYSVPVVVPPGTDRLEWSTAVYADIYNLTDQGVSAEVRQARCAVLRRAWHTVLRYLATMQVDEEFGYERMFPNRIRLTLSAVREGCLGFTYLGGSGLLPWQGTGVLDGRGNVAVDFAISLLDQGFVPVYSPLLGPRQPWLMVPAQRTHLIGSPATAVPTQRGTSPPPGIRLDPDFATRARLRRK